MKTKRTHKLLMKMGLILLSLLLSMHMYAQQRTITGQVIDQTGIALPGAVIKIKGTNQATSSDEKGHFSINVSGNNAVLSVSMMGYDVQEIPVGSKSILNFNLKEASLDLDEVVVVGYGTVRKRDLTGSVVSIKQNDITATPTTNVLESLQGKVAGMDMTKSSGETGSGLSFSIRGNRSLNASNAPLILVDGIPYDSNIDINPNAIESMEILKDASSTAIYGSRGANGVILITTKKGAAGKTRISYNAYYSANSVYAYPKMMNLQQWANFKREAYRTTGQWSDAGDDPKIFGSGYDFVKNNQYVDWVDLLLGNGHQMSHSISMSSGSEKTTFNISFEYMDEKGLVKLDNLKRMNGILSLEHKITNDFVFATSLIYTQQNRNQRRDPLNRAIYYSPYGDVYNEDGSINPLPFRDGQTISPIAEEIPGAYKNNTKTNHIVGNASLRWNIIKGLMAKTTFGFDYKSARKGHFADQYTLDGAGEYSKADATNTTNNNMTWENTLNYDITLDKHGLQLLAGNALYRNVEESYFGAGKDLISGSMYYHNLGATQREQEIGSNYIKTTMTSFFGRINYKFNERYLLTATLRTDGSSVLAEGKKWGFFPSVAGAWRIKEESFLYDVDYLSNLKLRLSYGISGNSAVSPYQTEGGLGQTMYAFDVNGSEEPAYGYYPRVIPNKNLTWEKTATTNIGIDFGFFNNRLSGSVDYYIQKTKDLLMQKRIPTTNGYSVAWDNVGKTENKGLEIVLSTLNINNKNFTWNTDLTFSKNNEKIVELSGGAIRDVSNGWFVGSPIKVHYALEKIGIWQLGEEAEAAKYKQKPGEIKIKDQDDSGSIDNDNDRIILGTERPDFVMGISNQLTYRNFDFRVFMHWRQGQMIRSEAHGSGYRIQGDPSPLVNYWTPENPTNDMPRPNKAMATNDFTLGSLGYKDGSFFKIKEITLGYKLQKNSLKQLPFNNLRIYGTLKNFFTFSHIGKYDPERGGSLSFPMTKQVVFGVNIDF